MFEEAKLREMMEQRREKQRMYRHAVERYWDIKTRIIAPEKEVVRKRILHRYVLDKKMLNDEINDLGDKIWCMQKNVLAGGDSE